MTFSEPFGKSANNTKTGVLLDCTGSMHNVILQRFPHEYHGGAGMDLVNVRGPLEVSARGIIGIGWVPDKSVTPHPAISREGVTGFAFAGFERHETPYSHIHITVTSASETFCGHLMEGSLLHGKPDPDKVDPITKRATFPSTSRSSSGKFQGVS